MTVVGGWSSWVQIVNAAGRPPSNPPRLLPPACVENRPSLQGFPAVLACVPLSDGEMEGDSSGPWLECPADPTRLRTDLVSSQKQYVPS